MASYGGGGGVTNPQAIGDNLILSSDGVEGIINNPINGLMRFQMLGVNKMTIAPTVIAMGVNGGAGVRFDGNVGFYENSPIAQQTGVPITAAGIHAALVNLGLITA